MPASRSQRLGSGLHICHPACMEVHICAHPTSRSIWQAGKIRCKGFLVQYSEESSVPGLTCLPCTNQIGTHHGYL